eukprot:2488475-Amphidinium_carterae.1
MLTGSDITEVNPSPKRHQDSSSTPMRLNAIRFQLITLLRLAWLGRGSWNTILLVAMDSFYSKVAS